MESETMDPEDGAVYQDDPGSSAVMSERVSGLATSIYRELERLIGRYDRDVVKELMPLVVAVLENLDSVFAENQEQEVELELLKEDNEQLVTQYEREKGRRRAAEERFIEFEDSQEQEKKELQLQVGRMESASRQLELKIKNYAEQIGRLEERESELKKEFSALHQRHTEMIHNYMEHVERIKIQQMSDSTELGPLGRVRKERPMSLCIFPSAGGASGAPTDPPALAETPSTAGWPLKDPAQPRSSTSLKPCDLDEPSKSRQLEGSQDAAWGNSLADDCKEELSNLSGFKPAAPRTPADPGPEGEEPGGRRAEGAGAGAIPEGEKEETSDMQDLIESTPELDMDLSGYKASSTPTKGIENIAFDRNTESLFEELSSAGTGIIGDVDEGADLLGMGREVENLILENTQLLETKNALNVVKNDLIARVDELGCEREVLQGELEAVLTARSRLEDRNRELEDELKKVRLEMEEIRQKSKDGEEDSDVPTAQRKRFTRVEMARVLMERNQYKERLMELQEAVRWTEMIRASRENPALSEKKKSSIWQFFSRLFSSAPAPASGSALKKAEPQPNMKYNAPGGLVKRSSTFSQFPTEKSKTLDFLNEEIDPCSSPSRKEQKRAQYRQVKAHMQREERRGEDGRVTAHGWSLPGKAKVSDGGQTENKMNLPVPVYLRPLDQKDASMKLWCAAGVNLSGGPTPPLVEGPTGSQSSLDQLEHDKEQEGGEPQEEVGVRSSRVWLCISTHSSTKVLVLDASLPSEQLDSFYACNTHVLCIASVPGVLETDFSAGQEPSLDPEGGGDQASLAGSVGSAGSDGPPAPEGTTAVPQTASARVSTGEHPPDTVPLSREGSPLEEGPPAEDEAPQEDGGVPTAEEATEATEANAGEEEGQEEGAPGPAQSQTYTEHVFTDPLGVGPAEGPRARTEREPDGATPQSEDQSEGEVLRMSSSLPTMWLGAQNGCLYVHSAVARWRKCLHAIKLKDSILNIVHVRGRVLVALADGTLAIFHRGADGQWDLTNYHLLDLGRPHHSIRCMAVVQDKVWCGYRNKIYVIQPNAMKIEKVLDAHPRKESQVRQLAWLGDGVWVSIRLDSTLRLFHALTHQHLQDVDIEPYVSKMLGTGKLGFSFVRITALMVSCGRLWVGTGNGVIVSIPLSEAGQTAGLGAQRPGGAHRPGGAVRMLGDEGGEGGPAVPYCSMAHAQLCFHGHRDAVKFFVSVPGTDSCLHLFRWSTSVCSVGDLSPGQAVPPQGGADSGSDDPPSESSDAPEPRSFLVMSGGEGYIDFRMGDEGSELDGLLEPADGQTASAPKTERSHLIVWQVAAGRD
ncbi:C-Jun-amino-terminal kinase-interacting protein 4-like isoform X2 [Gadus macrocephalus]|uniref:C-Jun-amino-terminal kinase-interacting protein 4-like isoform X2 n=1 Tax=Gadus macrocephalus TaxID=80720 RepID=UPI0028CBAF5F|nr:C-Jun-amino-terminal kinase-interacting protein 4-like isoform X2 [Gadus macrocephalus]